MFPYVMERYMVQLMHGPFENLCVTCAVSIIIFRLLPVFTCIKVFPLYFLYLISDHAFVFLTSVPRGASIHALSV